MVRDVLFSNGSIFLLVDSGIPPFTEQAKKMALEYTYIWNEHNLGFRAQYPSGYLFYIMMWFILNFIDINIFTRLLLVTTITFSALFMFLLLKKIGNSFLSAAVGGYLYAYSPTLFTHITCGRELYIFSYTLTPLYLYFLVSAFDRKEIKKVRIFIAGLLFALTASQLQFIILAPVVAFVVLSSFVKGFTFRKKITALLLTIMLGLTLHLPWVVPNLIVCPVLSQVLKEKFNYGHVMETSLKPFEAITLIGYVFPFFKDTALAITNIYPLFPAILVAFLSVPLIMHSKNKRLVLIELSLCLFMLLLFGPLLFSSCFFLLYSNLPFMTLFRQVYHLSFVIIFLYALISALFLDLIMRQKKFCKKILTAFFVVSLIGTSLPWYTGNFGGTFPTYDFSNLKELYDYLRNDTEPYRAVWLPLSWLVKYVPNSKTWGGDNFARYSAEMIEAGGPCSSSSLSKLIETYYLFYQANDSKALSYFLGNLNVKYIIIRENFTSILGCDYNSFHSILKLFNNSDDFEMVRIGHLDEKNMFYIFRNNNFKPRFFALNHTTKLSNFSYPFIDLLMFQQDSGNPYHGWTVYKNSWWTDPSLILYALEPDKTLITMKDNNSLVISLDKNIEAIFFEIYPLTRYSEVQIIIDEEATRNLNIMTYSYAAKIPLNFILRGNISTISVINKKGGLALMHVLPCKNQCDLLLTQLNRWELVGEIIPDANYKPMSSSFSYEFTQPCYIVTTSNETIHTWSGVLTSEINLNIDEESIILINTKIKGENVVQSHINIEGYDEVDNKWKFLCQVPHGLDGDFDWTDAFATIMVPKNITKLRAVLNGGWVYNINRGNATTQFGKISIYKMKKVTDPLMTDIKRKEVTYEKLNPTLWKVSINSTTPFMLCFIESYDQLWVANVYKNGKLVERVKPVKIYEAFNGFWIDQTGLLEVIIEYEPQKWFYIGTMISVTTLIACTTYLIYDWAKKKAIIGRIKKKIKAKTIIRRTRNS